MDFVFEPNRMHGGRVRPDVYYAESFLARAAGFRKVSLAESAQGAANTAIADNIDFANGLGRRNRARSKTRDK